jgi:Polyketide cyclase / dehydrase and lipid transport
MPETSRLITLDGGVGPSLVDPDLGENMSRWVSGFQARVAAILVVVLGVGAVLWIWPQNWSEQSEIQIQASPDQVFNYLERVDLWPQWLAWKNQDPSWIHVLGPIQKGLGASLQWNGTFAGVGSISLSQVRSPSLVQADIEMSRGGKGRQILEIQPDSSGIRLHITAEYNLGYNPWARYSLRHLRDQTRQRIQQECHTLKTLAEKDAQWASAQKAAAADSISQFPVDTISTEIPLAE